MRLLDRITTLLTADAHGLVESLEDRALLLQQHLREAELAADQTRARADALAEDDERLAAAVARLEAEARALDADVALALAGGHEDLARFAIRRLLPRQRELAALRADREERRAELVAVNDRLAAERATLDQLRTRVRAELARRRDPHDPGWSAAAAEAVGDEDVELELLRRRQGGAKEA